MAHSGLTFCFNGCRGLFLPYFIYKKGAALMFANFTEETCIGTGDTLALAGITTGNIPFSESFANGDLVAYVLEDSAGAINVPAYLLTHRGCYELCIIKC